MTTKDNPGTQHISFYATDSLAVQPLVERNSTKIIWGQGNMSYKHFWEQGVLLMGNKRKNPKRLRDQGNMYTPTPGRGSKLDVLMHHAICCNSSLIS